MKSLLIIAFTLFTASLSFAKPETKPVNKRLVIVDSKDVEMKGIEFAKKNKNAYIMRDCPVIGNKDSGLYHLPHQPNYNQMLVINKCADKGKCQDNRQCFDTVEEALATDVKACAIVDGRLTKCKKDNRIVRKYAASKAVKL